MVRGTAISGRLGIRPGNDAVLGAFASCTVEKKAAKRPEEFGDGGIKDVAGPESANNAGAADVVHPAADGGLPSNSVTPEIGRKRREIFVEED